MSPFTPNQAAFGTLGAFLIQSQSKAQLVEGVDFNMAWFAKRTAPRRAMPQPITLRGNPCGTIACAAGHAVFTDLAKPRRGESWAEYVGRIFFDTDSCYGMTLDTTFKWAFGPDWERFDNTPLSAGHRCLYVAEHGEAPPKFHTHDRFEWAFGDFTHFRISS